MGGKQAELDTLATETRSLRGATEKTGILQAEQARLQVVQNLLIEQNASLLLTVATKTSQEGVTEALNNTKSSQGQLNTEQSNSGTLAAGIGDGYDAAKASLIQLIAKQNELNVAQAAGNAQPKMHGGPIHRASGGPLYRAFGGFASRGTDTIPAMLSHGETVINARSSRRFASQINAMNAGVSPVYRAEGGVVNNSVNVGDINVNGTSDPDATARRVMSQIRREQRRGTSSSFK